MDAGDTSSLDTLYARAAEATRAGSRGFFFATQHFPLDLARAAHAVYWFCNHTQGLQTREDLDQWASLVDSGLRGRLARHPVLDVFLDTLDQRGIPHEYPVQFIDGVRTDLEQTRYATFADLRAFSYKSGGVLALMMTHVVGFREPGPGYMADLGIAIQLTSLLRDTGVHLARGRVYLPQDELGSFGYSEAELEKHVRNDAFRDLLRCQTARIADLYQKAELAMPLLDARGRFAVKVAFDLYRQTLRHIEMSDFDVFSRRPAVPAMERAWITARSMAGPVTRRLWRAMSA